MPHVLLAGLLGVDAYRGGAHFGGGLRTELLFDQVAISRDNMPAPLGLGSYVEAIGLQGDTVLGGGGAMRVPLGAGGTMLSPSAGAYARNYGSWQPGLTTGAFLGFGWLDGRQPMGVRIDGRYGLGSERALTVFVGIEFTALLPFVFLVGGGGG